MAVHSAQVRFDSPTGLAEDTLMNTWHFEGDGADGANVTDMLLDFYDALATRFATNVISGFGTMTLYNLEDATPRPPVFSTDFEITGATSGSPQVPEVSCCLSFAGEPESGIPRARLRNRVYLPTFKASALETDGRYTSATTDTVRDAAQALLDASDASINWKWVIYSPTRANAGSGPADGFTEVTHGWVDNAPDIQRRRGIQASARDTFST